MDQVTTASEGALNATVIAELRQLDPDGSLGLLNKILRTFKESAVTQLAAIKGAVVEENAGAVSRAAHQLKGAAMTIGAIDLGEACAELERMPAAPQAQRAITAIEYEHRRVQEAIDVLLGESKESAAEVVSEN